MVSALGQAPLLPVLLLLLICISGATKAGLGGLHCPGYPEYHALRGVGDPREDLERHFQFSGRYFSTWHRHRRSSEGGGLGGYDSVKKLCALGAHKMPLTCIQHVLL